MLSKEQAEQIRKQLIQQIDSSFPEDKKTEAKKQIQNMNPQELEEFLKQNNLVNRQGSQQQENQQCIFCSIIFGDIPSTKIGENKKAIAILEINPISKGHSLIIPKEHVSGSDSIPLEAQSLAQEVSKKIKESLNPKSITLSSSNLFGHEIINILPVYESENLTSERKQASSEELLELQKILEKDREEFIEEKTPEETEEINEKNTWLPRRIP